MNSFEQFTLIIGGLAILFEALRHIKAQFRHWFSTHKD